MQPEKQLRRYLGSKKFAARARETRELLETNVPITLEQIANYLGLPFEFFAICLAQKALEIDPCAVVVIDDHKEAFH